MQHLHSALTRLWLELAAPRARDERGDVPGWVLVTVMTAGLVTVIWGWPRASSARCCRTPSAP